MKNLNKFTISAMMLGSDHKIQCLMQIAIVRLRVAFNTPVTQCNDILRISQWSSTSINTLNNKSWTKIFYEIIHHSMPTFGIFVYIQNLYTYNLTFTRMPGIDDVYMCVGICRRRFFSPTVINSHTTFNMCQRISPTLQSFNIECGCCFFFCL